MQERGTHYKKQEYIVQNRYESTATSLFYVLYPRNVEINDEFRVFVDHQIWGGNRKRTEYEQQKVYPRNIDETYFYYKE